MPKRTDEALWEQQPGESSKAFEAFATYRNMGVARSTARVARELGKTKTLMDRWSSRWGWVERARAYDRDLDRQARERAKQDVRRMTDRHIRIAMQLQSKAIEALNQLGEGELTPKMMLAFLTKATEIERLNRLGVAGRYESGKKDGANEVEIVIEGEDDADGSS